MMTSTGLPANSDPGNSEAREPKGDEIIFISAYEAVKLWGPRVYKMEGTTWLWNDGQCKEENAARLTYSYRPLLSFCSRAVDGVMEDICLSRPGHHGSWGHDSSAAETILVLASRRHSMVIWLPSIMLTFRRDKPRFNPTILFNLFPSAAILYPEDFADIAKSTSSHLPSAFVMDHALLADRSAAFRGQYTGSTARTVASALKVGTASKWWWEPIRRQILRYSGVDEDTINRNLEGHGAIDPADFKLGPGVADLEPLAPPGTYTPVVTYISRQSSRRRLTADSHKDLVAALTERSKKIGFELVIVEAEKMTKEEQLALSARTTVSQDTDTRQRGGLLTSDHAWCAWQRSDAFVVDAGNPTQRSDRDVLPWRVR